MTDATDSSAWVHTVRGPTGTAVVAPRGAALLSFTTPSGEHLVLATESDGRRADCSGAVLAPWTNRIRDGRYDFQGKTHTLPLTEPERGAAVHGLVLGALWTRDRSASSSSRLVLRHELAPSPGYPHRLNLACSYEVTDAGLTVTVTARNCGRDSAPYAVGGHPYLIPPSSPEAAGRPGRVDLWRLEVPAGTCLVTDSDRLLPLGSAPVDGSAEDFRAGRSLRGARHDVALGDLARDSSGCFSCRLTGDDGRATVMNCGQGVRWIQVYTDDQGAEGATRRAVAVEPMSAPADAFNSEQDLTVLAPGEEHRLWWRIGQESD